MSTPPTRSATDKVDLIISLTAADAQVLAQDDGASDMVSCLENVLHIMAALRTGQVPRGPDLTEGDLDFWGGAVLDIYLYLLPRLQGIGDAVLRTAHAAGVSYTEIGLCSGVPRSTAQSRVQKLVGRPPTKFEAWAVAPEGAFLD
jgi:hypothetical protein